MVLMSMPRNISTEIISNVLSSSRKNFEYGSVHISLDQIHLVIKPQRYQ